MSPVNPIPAANDAAALVIAGETVGVDDNTDLTAEVAPPHSMRDAALALAAEGFYLFPLPPRQKRATMEKWPERATNDRAQVEAFFPAVVEPPIDLLGNAECNIGIVAGRGLLVVDIDPRHGGDASLITLQRERGQLPPTRSVRTPSGGQHLYFKVPIDQDVPNSTSKLGAGLDVKGDAGYVAAPPSVTDVGAYRWENPGAPITDAPAWLVELATKPRAPKEPNNSGTSLTNETPTHDLTVADAREMLKHLDAGCSYEEWAGILWSLRRMALGAQDGSTVSEWFALADEWSRGSTKYPGAEGVEEKWRQADTRESGYGLRHLIELAKAGGYKPPPRVAKVEAFPPVVSDPGTPPPPVNVEPPPALPAIEFKKLRRGLYHNPPPPRAFALGGYLPKGIASKFSGPGQLGKSMIMVYAALCQAVGREFCGHACAAGRVVYLSAEDEFEEFERRMHRLLRALYPQGLPQEVEELLDRNLQGVDLVESGTDCLLTSINSQGRVAITPFVEHVAKLIGTAELVVFDTQSRFHGGPENDNTAGAVFIRALEVIAKKTGAAVCAISHVGKGRDADASQYDRGASSLVDNARGGMKLTLLPPDIRGKITEDQLAKAERGDIVRLVHSKNSYGRKHNDVYFERRENGVLLPTVLMYKTVAGPSAFAPTPADFVEHLIGRVGNGEVSRNQVRDDYQTWCGPTATREEAEQAFNAAVKAGRLVFNRKYRKAELYRVADVPALFSANDDLVGGGAA